MVTKGFGKSIKKKLLQADRKITQSLNKGDYRSMIDEEREYKRILSESKRRKGQLTTNMKSRLIKAKKRYLDAKGEYQYTREILNDINRKLRKY